MPLLNDGRDNDRLLACKADMFHIKDTAETAIAMHKEGRDIDLITTLETVIRDTERWVQ